MRRLIPTVLLGAGVLMASPVADAAAPSFRDRIDDTYEIEDFCDSGVTVEAHERTTAQGWETDRTLKFAFNRTTYTYSDRAVSDHWAGRSCGVLVGGDLDGEHTEFWQENGLRAYLRAPSIGTVTRDGGNLQYLISFTEDGPDEGEDPDFADFEVVKDAGNPSAGSRTSRMCFAPGFEWGRERGRGRCFGIRPERHRAGPLVCSGRGSACAVHVRSHSPPGGERPHSSG
jgi:hypothetical protein